MKKIVLALCFLGSSAFAGNSQIGSSDTQSCDGSTLEMRICLHELAAKEAKILKAKIDLKKKSVKESMESENIDAQFIKQRIDSLNKVPKQIEEAVGSYCAAEGAEETTTGSMGALIAAGCTQEKLKALNEIFK